MKRTFAFCLLIATLIASYSCKEKNSKNEEQKIDQKSYSIDLDKTSIHWTAYKTSDKVPVKGEFLKFDLENNKEGVSAKDVLNGLKFSIPVKSVFSKDSIRDGKLNTFFFDVMKDTKLISGTISLGSKDSGTVDLKMNGINKNLPISYSIENNIVTFIATMTLDNWQAQSALNSLNKACKLLHTGLDGIAKTWNEVDIIVIVPFNVE
jgi:hypothetical protein